MNDVHQRMERSDEALRRRWRRAFGLTPAELRLAEALVRGTSLKDYAEQVGIAEGTARVQLKAVFAKTNTHRQAELVSLLWRIPRH
ncbi:MAG: LuxR C-terminal-related transcriptional regulator [Hyphomicrobiales bacterium]